MKARAPTHHFAAVTLALAVLLFAGAVKAWHFGPRGVSHGVMRDSDIAGGQWLRKADRFLSNGFGGYQAENLGKPLSMYGKYVEPVLHAAEHARRGIVNRNPTEIARAKDELKAVGSGLKHGNPKYQAKQSQLKTKLKVN